MSKTLTEIAKELRDSSKKVQLIYAFNGSGKTRLSRGFRLLVDPKEKVDDDEEKKEYFIKVMYYNAFTEDLFYWDNDLDADTNRKLIIRPNNFTDFALGFLKDEGLDFNIITNFQRFTSDKITPEFNDEYTEVRDGKEVTVPAYSEITFSFAAGGDNSENNIKISKAEESNFIWCVFYTLLEQAIETLNETDKTNRSTDKFDDLKYVFIDDPVSSLDDNHLIELAVKISKLVKASRSDLKFIITTHNPLFYNVISNELNNKEPNKLYIEGELNEGIAKWVYKETDSLKYRFMKKDDGTFDLFEVGRKTPFSYHLQLLREIQKAKGDLNEIKKYHFNFMRNILEKSTTFLGYSNWESLLPKVNGEPDPHAIRVLNLYSHSTHAGDEVAEIQEKDRNKLIELVGHLESNYKFSKLIEQNESI